jgi:PEGA domain
VEAHDELSDRDADLVRAAEAAASWARARRATWTNLPPDVVATAPSPVEELPAPSPSHPAAAARTATVAARLAAVAARIAAVAARTAAAAARTATSVRSFEMPGGRWPARAAVAVALGMAALVGVPYVWKMLPTFALRTPVVEPTEARPRAVARKATGELRVSSTPVGARVLVDGKARGVTPLTLSDLSPGSHEVALEGDGGTIHRSVTVAANETAVVEESIFSGWLAVYAPFEVVIAEGGRTLRPDERNQIMLPPGIHALRLVNRTLAYEKVSNVEIKPGETTNLQVTPEPSTLTVTASEAADVWLDGARVGETPLNAVPVPLGSHELVVKRSTGGERRFSVTIGVNPFTLNVEFH